MFSILETLDTGLNRHPISEDILLDPDGHQLLSISYYPRATMFGSTQRFQLLGDAHYVCESNKKETQDN